MLAIMVDLGWPWWVTTLIAVVAAVVAAMALVRTRRVTIRALSALILLEAIAIAVAAPFVMDSDDKEGPSAMSSSLSLSEYARRADANCREFGAFAATLGNPKTPAGIERQMDAMLPELWRSYVKQQDLEPPPEQQVTARKWMHAMAAFGRDFEALRAAASRRDAKAIERANANAGTHAAESARLSKQLGMRACFQ